ncbi:MAG TPA: PEP-CTERM sorting domain-containing protein [Gemmatimonas sp.]|nr:PEP-CTERM sorting domain-containing protein [Gemmatimonas sp.]
MLKTGKLLLPVLIAFPFALEAQVATERDSSRSVTQPVSGVLGIGAGVFSFFSGGGEGESRSANGWCVGPCYRRAIARSVMQFEDAVPFRSHASDAALDQWPSQSVSPTASAESPSQANAAMQALEMASPSAAFNRPEFDAIAERTATDNASPPSPSSLARPSARAQQSASPNAAFNRVPSGTAVTTVGDATGLPWQAAPAAQQYEWLGPVQGSGAPIAFTPETSSASAVSFEWVLPPAPELTVQQDVRVIVNPEPSTILLMLAGLGTLAYIRMRRRPG